MTLRGRLADRVPAPISLRLRGKRSVRRVFGLHPPADLITSLVPTGKNAIDVGANRGVYAYWMAKRADIVDAFEPQPELARYIRSARLRNVRVHEIALSDHATTARLLVPSNDGLARLASPEADEVQVAAEAELGATTELSVQTQTLDSLGLLNVGFLKIDIEGHEMAVLQGAEETIATNRPIVFVESEARHARGAPANVIERMRDHHGYARAEFVRGWKIVELEEFDLQRDQIGLLPDFSRPDYVSNFVFWPS
jgi:FkbM family methyltransferase